jgi:Flp pilus assembly protein TadG
VKSKCTHSRSRRGQSMIEVMTAFFILIPVGLGGLDLFTYLSVSQQNEQLAETACRAAATKDSQRSALDAAQDACNHVSTGAIIQSADLQQVLFDPSSGFVTVTTSMQVKMPVPLPLFNNCNVQANAIQPIVSTPAPR